MNTARLSGTADKIATSRLKRRVEGVAKHAGVCSGDFNQNNRDRTIASAYSLRPLPGAPVSTPVTWDELVGVASPGDYNLFTVPERVAEGDPWAEIDDVDHDLTPLLDLFEEQGSVELNFPPDYPKMPREPPRVQPSKKVAEHWDDDGNRIEDQRARPPVAR